MFGKRQAQPTKEKPSAAPQNVAEEQSDLSEAANDAFGSADFGEDSAFPDVAEGAEAVEPLFPPETEPDPEPVPEPEPAAPEPPAPEPAAKSDASKALEELIEDLCNPPLGEDGQPVREGMIEFTKRVLSTRDLFMGKAKDWKEFEGRAIVGP